MDKTWIIITNASDAFFYQIDNKAREKGKINIELISSYHHPESRKKESELISDRSGHFSKTNRNAMSGGASYNNPTDPKKHEAEVFAKQISNELTFAKNDNQFQQLILISPPQFFGMLNKHLSKNIMNVVISKIEKDYTKLPKLDLLKYLKSHLTNSD